MCAQRRAEKRISTEEDFVESNIASFGNDIGQTTNWITSMFEVQSHFDKDSEEYKILAYRINCGQLYQQNAIDKAKGIVCKPMPKYWHDRYAVSKIEDEDERNLNRSIVADKKPYFMRYIYPALQKQYNTYIKNTDNNSIREFGLTVSELKKKPYCDLTDRQKEFLMYYDRKMPVGVGDCVMNKICRMFEEEFDGYIRKHNSEVKFDYTIMKSSEQYNSTQYYAIKKLYDDFNRRVKNYTVFAGYERIDKVVSDSNISVMKAEFIKECSKQVPSEKILCNIILDICYKKNSTKRFAWDMCCETIINNLLEKNEQTISYPTLSEDGDIYFGGMTYELNTMRIEVD